MVCSTPWLSSSCISTVPTARAWIGCALLAVDILTLQSVVKDVKSVGSLMQWIVAPESTVNFGFFLLRCPDGGVNCSAITWFSEPLAALHKTNPIRAYFHIRKVIQNPCQNYRSNRNGSMYSLESVSITSACYFLMVMERNVTNITSTLPLKSLKIGDVRQAYTYEWYPLWSLGEQGWCLGTT